MSSASFQSQCSAEAGALTRMKELQNTRLSQFLLFKKEWLQNTKKQLSQFLLFKKEWLTLREKARTVLAKNPAW